MAIPVDAIKSAAEALFELYETYEDYVEQIEDCQVMLYSLQKICADRATIDSLSKATDDEKSPGHQLALVFRQVRNTIDFFRLKKTSAQKLMFGAQVKGKMEELERLTRRIERILKMVELETATASAQSLALLAGQHATNFIGLPNMKKFWSTNFGANTRVKWQDFSGAVMDEFGGVLEEYLGGRTKGFLNGLGAMLDGDGDGIVDVREFANLVNVTDEDDLAAVRTMNFIEFVLSRISDFNGLSDSSLSFLVMGSHVGPIVLLRHVKGITKEFVVSADTFGVVKVWSPETINEGLQLVSTFRVYSEQVTAACILDENAASGVQLCIGGSDGDLCIADVYSSCVSAMMDNHGSPVRAITTAKGRLFVCGTKNTVTVYDINTRSKVFQLHGHHDEVIALAVVRPKPGADAGTAIPHMLISGSRNGELRGWDATTLECIFTVSMPDKMSVETLVTICSSDSLTATLAVLQTDTRRAPRISLVTVERDPLNEGIDVAMRARLMEDFDEAQIVAMDASADFLVYTVKTEMKARNKNTIRCLNLAHIKGTMNAGMTTWRCRYESKPPREPTSVLLVNGYVLWGDDSGGVSSAPVVRSAACAKGHALHARKVETLQAIMCTRCGGNCTLAQRGCFYACPICAVSICFDCVGSSHPVTRLALPDVVGSPSATPSDPSAFGAAPVPLHSSGSFAAVGADYYPTDPRLVLVSGRGIWVPHGGSRAASQLVERGLASQLSSSAVFAQDRIVSANSGAEVKVFDHQGRFLWTHRLLKRGMDGVWRFVKQSERNEVALNVDDRSALNVESEPGITVLKLLPASSQHPAIAKKESGSCGGKQLNAAVPVIFIGTDNGQIASYRMHRDKPWSLLSSMRLFDGEQHVCTECTATLSTVHERVIKTCISCARTKSERRYPPIPLERAWMLKPPSHKRDDPYPVYSSMKWKRKLVWVTHGPDGLVLKYLDEGEPDNEKAKQIPIDNATIVALSSEVMKTMGCEIDKVGGGWQVTVGDRVIVLAAEEEEARDQYVETLSPTFVTPHFDCLQCVEERVPRGRLLCAKCFPEMVVKRRVRISTMAIAPNRSLFVGCSSPVSPGGYVVEVPLSSLEEVNATVDASKTTSRFASSIGSMQPSEFSTRLALTSPLSNGTNWRWRIGSSTLCTFGSENEYLAISDGQFAPFVRIFAVQANPSDTSPARSHQVASLDETSAPVTSIYSPTIRHRGDAGAAGNRNILYVASDRILMYLLVRDYNPQRPHDHQLQTSLRGVFLWPAAPECGELLSMAATPRTLCAGFRSGGVLVWRGVKAALNDTQVNYVCGPILKLTGHTGAVTAMGFSPRGDLYTQANDNTIHFWDYVPMVRMAFRTKRRRPKRGGSKHRDSGATATDLASLATESTYGDVDDMEEGASSFFDNNGDFIPNDESADGTEPGPAQNQHAEESDEDSQIDHDQWVWKWSYTITTNDRDLVAEGFDLCDYQASAPHEAIAADRNKTLPFSLDTARQLNDLWSDVRDFGHNSGVVQDKRFGKLLIDISETGEWTGCARDNVRARMTISATAEVGGISDSIFVRRLEGGRWNTKEEIRHGSDIELRSVPQITPGSRHPTPSEVAAEMIMELSHSAMASHLAMSQLKLHLTFTVLGFQSNYDEIEVTFLFARTSKEEAAKQGSVDLATLEKRAMKRCVTVRRQDATISVPMAALNREEDLFGEPCKLFTCFARITSPPARTPAVIRFALASRDHRPILDVSTVPSTWGLDVIPPATRAQASQDRESVENPLYAETAFQLHACRACGTRQLSEERHMWRCSKCGIGRINQKHQSIRCPICRRRLGLFNRRNCYSCGQLVCLSCSHEKVVPFDPAGNPIGYDHPVHSCRFCANQDPAKTLFAPSMIDIL